MGFKGTKGKWNIEPPIAKGSWIGNENGYSALSCGNTNEENRANALLISKAPEMLEMLNECLEMTKALQADKMHAKISKLIKEATEL